MRTSHYNDSEGSAGKIPPRLVEDLKFRSERNYRDPSVIIEEVQEAALAYWQAHTAYQVVPKELFVKRLTTLIIAN